MSAQHEVEGCPGAVRLIRRNEVGDILVTQEENAGQRSLADAARNSRYHFSLSVFFLGKIARFRKDGRCL